jgi:regulator of cell morphogenesis and NO signaling
MSEPQDVFEQSLLSETIGSIVADDYRAANIFDRYRIDFCCGGNVPLAEACRNQGIDPDLIIKEIAALGKSMADRGKNHGQWPLPLLIDYIVNIHHVYINEHGPQLLVHTQKIVEVHGERHPELKQIATIFKGLMDDLKKHLRDEEERFFPAFKNLYGAQKDEIASLKLNDVRTGLARLRSEHETAGGAIHAIRRLSGDFLLPGDACNTYAVAYQGLEAFEKDLHQHVHLENNIVFPKVDQLLKDSG